MPEIIFVEKETLTHVFSWEYHEIFKNTNSKEQLQTATS